MATVSQTATTLTSPAYMWEGALPAKSERLRDERFRADGGEHYLSDGPLLASRNGSLSIRGTASFEPYSPGDNSHEEADFDPKAKANGPTRLPQNDHKDLEPRSLQDYANPEDAPDPQIGTNGERAEGTRRKGPGGPQSESDSDDSKWIHRDKLAKIESEELQAAGIIIPRQRDRARSKSQNRPRRDQSQDKVNGSGRSIGGSEHAVSRSRKNSAATSVETKTLDSAAIPNFDLRRPEEILEEVDGHWVTNGNGKGSSRIPVAKASPVPIPSEHLARDTRLPRKRDGSPGAEDNISYPKTRSRSGSTGNALTKPAATAPASQPTKRPDSSPKKPATTATAKKPKPVNGTASRPKTRGGISKDSTGSGTRPSTRSAEREFSSSNCKPMEGEPPWMVSAYRPDPRLPPDQQLLPTVAKRLLQEKWEREGKFGSVYDKEFRPLTDEGFLRPPESNNSPDKETDRDAEKEEQKEEQKEDQRDWPLKGEPKSPTFPTRTNSYSTMPKITDTPAANSLPSPRAPSRQTQQAPTIRVPEPPEETQEKKGGCGCCIVM